MGTKPRRPAHFPRMKNRARKRRRWRPTVRIWGEDWEFLGCLDSGTKIVVTRPKWATKAVGE